MLPSRTLALSALALAIGLTAAACAPASNGGAAGAKEPPQGAAAAPEQGAVAPAASGDAQQPALGMDAQQPPTQAAVGGFSAQDPATPQMQAAAGRAIQLLQARAGDPSIALVKVASAETQVVAGLNYRLKLDVTTKAGPKAVTVVMYRDIKGNHELSSVEGL